MARSASSNTGRRVDSRVGISGLSMGPRFIEDKRSASNSSIKADFSRPKRSTKCLHSFYKCGSAGALTAPHRVGNYNVIIVKNRSHRALESRPSFQIGALSDDHRGSTPGPGSSRIER